MPIPPSAESLPGRLRMAIHARNTTAAAVSKACGFSRQNMQRFLNGDVARSGHFEAIARFLKIPVTWLTVGDPTGAPKWASATPGKPWSGTSPSSEDTGVSPPSPWQPHWELLAIQGDGGMPYAHDGDVLILDPTGVAAYNDVLLSVEGGRHVLKRRGAATAQGVIVASIDQGRDAEVLLEKDLARMRVVVGTLFGRGGKPALREAGPRAGRGRVGMAVLTGK